MTSRCTYGHVTYAVMQARYLYKYQCAFHVLHPGISLYSYSMNRHISGIQLTWNAPWFQYLTYTCTGTLHIWAGVVTLKRYIYV